MGSLANVEFKLWRWDIMNYETVQTLNNNYSGPVRCLFMNCVKKDSGFDPCEDKWLDVEVLFAN